MERLTFIDQHGWYAVDNSGERVRGPHVNRLAALEDILNCGAIMDMKERETMAEYIDREVFIQDIQTEIINLSMDGLKDTRMPHDELYQFIEWIKEQPAANVVEVVRCQNCAYSHKGCDSDMTKEIWCTYWQKTEGKAWNMMHFDDFCSHGAKMDLKDLEESK